MPAFSTYSFNDIIMTFSHPSYTQYIMNGQGIGDVAISWPNENTSTDIAADGAVMMGKIRADVANVAISIQQTSSFHSWLKGLFNFLNGAPAELWAAGAIKIQSISGGFDDVTLSNVAFAKRSDQPYADKPQRVTWNFVAASGHSLGSTIANATNFINSL